MNNSPSKGLDSEGHILNSCSLENIQDEFKNLVNEKSISLQLEFPEVLHSLYLYGSIARGHATVGKSDLDFVVVFNRNPTEEEQAKEKVISENLHRKYPLLVSKVDFGICSIDEVNASGQELYWQFFLKHCCVCIYGNDPSTHFAKTKPSMALAKSLNKGLERKVNLIKKETSAENVNKQSKDVAKLLLRSSYFMIMESDRSFYNCIEDCAKALMHYHPEKSESIKTALLFTRGENNSLEKFFLFIENWS